MKDGGNMKEDIIKQIKHICSNLKLMDMMVQTMEENLKKYHFVIQTIGIIIEDIEKMVNEL